MKLLNILQLTELQFLNNLQCFFNKGRSFNEHFFS